MKLQNNKNKDLNSKLKAQHIHQLGLNLVLGQTKEI
jgi:hypothetical protein